MSNDVKIKVSAAHEQTLGFLAEIIARHRQEWVTLIALRNEALGYRKMDIQKAIEMAEIAKSTAQAIAVKQNAERKTYGLR